MGRGAGSGAPGGSALSIDGNPRDNDRHTYACGPGSKDRCPRSGAATDRSVPAVGADPIQSVLTCLRSARPASSVGPLNWPRPRQSLARK